MHLRYEKGSLFDAPEGSYIAHACNTQGVWGAGIAYGFKLRYPKANEIYSDFCNRTLTEDCIGSSLIIPDKHNIVCLFTSEGFGKQVDKNKVILENTLKALVNFCEQLTENQLFLGMNDVVYSNRFNSGLFGVPWELTEKALKHVLAQYPRIVWIVRDL
jgi:ADP-ribose 1''-phosphate phosphatase